MKKSLYLQGFIVSFIVVTIVVAAKADALVLLQDLSRGSRGAEVQVLQKFLNTNPATILTNQNEEGGRGRETEFYGPLTENAVRRFQQSNPNLILRPFGRTDNGITEVMTRFEIMLQSIAINPELLNDVAYRERVAALLNQVSGFVSQYAATLSATNVNNQTVIQDNQNLLTTSPFVNNGQSITLSSGSVITTQTTDFDEKDVRTINDLNSIYDFYNTLDVQNQYVTPTDTTNTVILDDPFNQALDTVNNQSYSSTAFDITSSGDIVDVDGAIILFTKSFGVQAGSALTVYGANFDDNDDVLLQADDKEYKISTKFISSEELQVTIPSNVSSGVWSISVKGSLNPAKKIFVFQKSTCNRVFRGTSCLTPRITGVSPSKPAFGENITLSGYNFTSLNVVESAFGVIEGISNDGQSVNFTLNFSNGEVAFQLYDQVIPVTFTLLNGNGISNSYTINVTLRGQQPAPTGADVIDAGLSSGSASDADTASGLQTAVGNIVGGVVEGVVTSVITELGQTAASFAKAAARSIISTPFGGRIAVSFPCTCSGNYYVAVVNNAATPPGFAPLVFQPGYSRLYSNFNIFTPGTNLLGTYTPGAGICLMATPGGCYPHSYYWCHESASWSWY